ncbi:MAG: D-arabinono-1,4-lactone oxidase [Candidatus Nanopelagicales bacterium]
MLRNWSDTVDLGGRVATPRSTAEVAELVRGADRVLALGSAHSFSPVAVTPGLHIETAALPADIAVNGTTVTVSAGMTYATLGRELHARGLGLAAMASLPHITVGGAIATGTHGSGDAIGTLSSAVTGIEIVTAGGHVRWVRRGVDPDFGAWVVSIGALGVVTRVEMEVEPTYEVAQTIFAGLDLDVVEADFDAVFGSATSVSVFTRWRPEPDAQLWLKRRIDREGPWPGGPAFGVPPRDDPLHPLEQLDPVHCNPQRGQVGPWHERLPHFRAEFTPSAGDEIQAEYLLPRTHAVEAIRALRALHARITPLLHVTEIRTMRGDDLWLSPAYGADTVGIHFTWHRDDRIYDVLPEIEEIVLPLGARPHWGKVSTATPEQLQSAFPKLTDFLHFRAQMDPDGRFCGPFVTHLMGAAR